MTNPAQIREDTMASGSHMILALGGIAIISGILVVLVFQLTLPLVNENKRLAIERAVFKVLPGTHTRENFLINSQGVFSDKDAANAGVPVYAGFSGQGAFLGIAAEAAAPGYQDVIRILFGYKPECQCITGIKVLKMAETPGLGDKIDKDAEFLENFAALDARPNVSGDRLLNPILTVKHGNKTKPWQIDAISGATISSKAIGKMLNETAQRLIPLVEKFKTNFKMLQNKDDSS